MDVTPGVDIATFIDPHRIVARAVANPKSVTLSLLRNVVDSFFAAMASAVCAGTGLDHLLSHAGEARSTHLGYSKPGGTGTGMGDHCRSSFGSTAVQAITECLSMTDPIITGLEDLVILVPDVGPDRVSDLLTNVLSHELGAFTERMIAHITQRFGKRIFPFTMPTWGWDASVSRWTRKSTTHARLGNHAVLLVPRHICSTDPVGNAASLLKEMLFLCLKQRSSPAVQSALGRYSISRSDMQFLTVDDLFRRVGASKQGGPKDAVYQIAKLNPAIYRQAKSTALSKRADKPEVPRLVIRQRGSTGSPPGCSTSAARVSAFPRPAMAVSPAGVRPAASHTSGVPEVLCPHCKIPVRTDRLERHVTSRCASRPKQ